MRPLLSRFLPFFACAILWHLPAFAQKKKTTPTPKDDLPKIDTVIIIEESSKPKKQVLTPLFDVKETVITVDTAGKSTPRPTYRDTVIVLKKAMTKEELEAREKERIAEMLKKNNFCNCIKMDVQVKSVLQYETYINYAFVFKNDCKIDAWISSKHFRYVPYNAFDKPVKVLRKLNFVKRYDHPDFVKIAPGETYTFDYADDAFFEYDLDKGQTYKFIFEHRNFGDRAPLAPEKTYLCGQKRVHMISVR